CSGRTSPTSVMSGCSWIRARAPRRNRGEVSPIKMRIMRAPSLFDARYSKQRGAIRTARNAQQPVEQEQKHRAARSIERNAPDVPAQHQHQRTLRPELPAPERAVAEAPQGVE